MTVLSSYSNMDGVKSDESITGMFSDTVIRNSYVPCVVAALAFNWGKADCDLNSSDLIDKIK